MTAPLDVLLVDDHRLLSESLVVALRAQGLTAEVADLADRQQLIDDVRARRPGLVLLDLDLGGDLGDGVTLVRPFHDVGSVVLVVTGSLDPAWLGAALEQGAVGVRSKTGAFSDLLDDVVAAARGEAVMSAADRARAIEDLRRERARASEALEPFARLTSRESDVLRALGQGRSVAQIAVVRVVSEATVRSQVKAVLSKLEVGSQLEAVALALRVGWLRPPGAGYAGPVPPDGPGT